VQVDDITRIAPDPRRLTLLTAAPKGPRLDWLIEKCTELGVATLILAEFERSVVRLAPSASARHMRTTVEASKQCGRLWLPELRCGESLREAIGHPDEQLLVCDPSPHGRSLANHLWSSVVPERVTVVVGPEGGIAPAEQDWLSQRGAVPVRLSDTILRIETAAAAVAAVWAAFRCDAVRP
jgi:16S rRNA (uracil1498-N3)-methyltransferase